MIYHITSWSSLVTPVFFSWYGNGQVETKHVRCQPFSCRKPCANGHSQLELLWVYMLVIDPRLVEGAEMAISKDFVLWYLTNYLVVSNIFDVHPYLGKWFNLTDIFQMGWNHRLVQHFDFQLRAGTFREAGYLNLFWNHDLCIFLFQESPVYIVTHPAKIIQLSICPGI